MTIKSLCASLLLMFMVLAAPIAVHAKEGEGEKKHTLYGELAQIASELKLDDATVTKLADVQQQSEDALKQWDKDNTSKLAKIKRASTDAHEAGNDDEVKARSDEATKLQDDRRALADKYTGMAFDVLTADQQSQYLSAKLTKLLLKSYPTIKFTDEQKRVIQSRSRVMVEGHQNSRDEKVWAGMVSDLRASVDKDVLTDEQTKQLLKALDGAGKRQP